METPQTFKRAMVFGVFDGLHEGHCFFLQKAKARCEKLTVVVAQDATALLLKKHLPQNPLAARITAIREFDKELEVMAGDEESGSWNVLKKDQPDTVFLGYDQKALSEELKKINIPFIFLPSHQPEKYKTSLLQ